MLLPRLAPLWPPFAALLALGCASLQGDRANGQAPLAGTRPLASARQEQDAVATVRSDNEATKSSDTATFEPSKAEGDLGSTPLPRIFSVALFTQIYARPARLGAPLGYVHLGSAVPLRSAQRMSGGPCAGHWYAVLPRGYICNDNTTILETEQKRLSAGAARLVRGLVSASPSEGPLPYRYALSLGAPMYGKIPTSDEQAEIEATYGAPHGPLGTWARGHEDLADAEPGDVGRVIPWYFAHGEFSPVNVRGRDARLVRKIAPPGSMISFDSSFEADGRTWLVTPELSLVPADRTRVYRKTSFQGVTLEGALSLPLAWIRRHRRPKFRRGDDDKLVPTDQAWEVRTAVGLTGAKREQDDRVFLETTEPRMFIERSDATVVEQSSRLPRSVRPHEKWMQISILKGTLTAYEGDRAVFATLISPGTGGVPDDTMPTRELVSRHATPLGTYRIQYKDRYTVMSPDPEQKKFFIADVPHIQFFRGPFALHAAFWHEDFGERKSGGCVNLSPPDAARLFAWTTPELPSGWQGVRTGKENGSGTVVQIVR